MIVSEPRWLDAEERRAWVAFIVATRLLFAELERDIQREAGMPLTYYEVLSMLSEEPGRALRLNALSDLLQVSPSRLSHAVDRMEESGWIRRERCPSDRRGWSAVLTDAGYNVLVRAAPHHVESVRRRLLDALTPQQLAALGEISQTLLDHLNPQKS